MYDRVNVKYIANTRNEEKAHTLVTNLTCRGFEGDIPNFFYSKEKYGMNLDGER